jgi:membrane peptidoglycan carboxypeptidase
MSDAVFGKTKKDRAKIWNRGGLTIRTTLDPQAQKSVQASIKQHVKQSDDVATAATIVEPGTGKILAMGQSRPYGFGKSESAINLSVDKSMNGGAGYQPGSTFKPIVAAAAIEGGKPATQSYSSPYEMAYPSPVAQCDGKTWVNTDGAKLTNENESEKGPYAMKEATAKSVNTYYVQLISDIGICPVTQMAKNMGVERADGGKISQVPSIALGTQEMSPLTMANAYATFASRGTYCTPIAIESITQKLGGEEEKPLAVPKSTCTRAMSEKTADTINTILRGVVEDGTGQQAGLDSRPSAGKTGTTDSRYAAWFVGYTPNMSGAVWVGDPQHKRRMVDITIGGVYHDKVYGGQVPGPIWKDAMTGALAGKPAPDFNLIHIPDPVTDKDKDKGKNRDDKGNNDGATQTPLPSISIPPDFLGGTGNGGTTNGNGNGGNWP